MNGVSVSYRLPNSDFFLAPIDRLVDSYFRLTNTSSPLETALKVISYATLIIPAIAFGIKMYLNYCRKINLDIFAISVKPANLFLDTVIGPNGSTLSAKDQPFEISMDHREIRKMIASGNNLIFQIKAGDGTCEILGHGQKVPLKEIYGNNTFAIHQDELKSLLKSQKTYLHPSFPKPFYDALKNALKQDGVSKLPTSLENGGPNCKELMENVRERWQDYGFDSLAACEAFLSQSFYEMASLVVKVEDYYSFTNSDGTIRKRSPYEWGPIRMINTYLPQDVTMMAKIFETIFKAAHEGYVIFSDAQIDDPIRYWQAFFLAVTEMPDSIERIFINSQQVLLDQQPPHPNLKKITNLYAENPNILQLSHELNTAFPNKTISLVNATHPDVTLGNRIGDNINSCEPYSTEAIYTALGTKGITNLQDSEHNWTTETSLIS